jgi:methionyl-tRNA formyltransferase
VDAGDILLSESVEIGPEETAAELRVRLARLGADVVLRALAGLADGTLQPRPQAHQHATQAPKLTKADGAIDFGWDARTVVCRILGTWPWPGARADFHRADRPTVRVTFARARPASTGGPNPAAGGTVADDLRINVADGRVEVLELKVAGKRLMGWKDFVNGYRVRPGDRFVSVQTGAPRQ